jgi:DNA (cytosine-5)-methyltransferase 1
MWTHIVGAGVTGEGRPRPADHPAPTITGKGTAYLLAGADRWRAGRNVLTTGEAVRLAPAEAAAVQGFPADHPWQGNRAAIYQQVGNAVPPPLAEAILRAATRRQP